MILKVLFSLYITGVIFALAQYPKAMHECKRKDFGYVLAWVIGYVLMSITWPMILWQALKVIINERRIK